MINVQQLLQGLLPVGSIGGNFQKEALVTHAKKHTTKKEAKYSRHQIIQIALTTPGDQSARSGAGKGHAYAKNQSSD